MIQTINLLPEGVKCEPFFKTEEEYQRFREEFIAEMEKHRMEANDQYENMDTTTIKE